MAASYWEMVAGIANRGLIDEDLYFETTLEPWILFEKLRPILADWRAVTKTPTFFSQLEEHSKRLETWRESGRLERWKVCVRSSGKWEKRERRHKGRRASCGGALMEAVLLGVGRAHAFDRVAAQEI